MQEPTVETSHVESPSPARRKRAKRRPPPPWAHYSDEALLNLRLCDLGVRITGSWLERRIELARAELKKAALLMRPHFWLSSEWFTPDGVPGVAIPFYLAHPRLIRLEEKQLLEAEGANHEWCMRLLRHELGHAVSNAYRLHRRKEWRRVFGRVSQPYPAYYQPKAYSKKYVLHLDSWYAQSHPAEDFAETFAVWLTPSVPWRKRYAGWPALKKLVYVDEAMRKLAGVEPLVKSRRRVEPVHTLGMTLREHYEQRRAYYGTDYPKFYDRDLRRLFVDAAERPDGEPAARFLRRVSPDVRRMVARWTGEFQYTIDQVLKEMIERCRELKLRVGGESDAVKLEATVLLTVQTMNYLHAGKHRLAL